jgi:hypothetical protein
MNALFFEKVVALRIGTWYERMQIFYKSLNGMTYTLQTGSWATVENIKD